MIKPIKTKDDYKKMLARIDEIIDAKEGSPEADELEVLSLLVGHYEDTHFPIEYPDAIEAIKIRMEDLGLKPKDLIPYIGQQSHVSEVLAKKRKLSMSMIKKLSVALNLPAGVLVGLEPGHIPISRLKRAKHNASRTV